MTSSPVAVIGGGLQGCCLALALAERGIAVDLIESAPQIMQGASRFNEGKIHLGYTYAADASLTTARRQARGAVTFSPLLRRWVGRAFDKIPVSAPVRYGVHVESQFQPAELHRRYEAIADVILHEFEDAGSDYLGVRDPHDIAHIAPEVLAGVDESRVTAIFSTGERSIEPTSLADAVVAAISRSPLINVLTGIPVNEVATAGSALKVSAKCGEWEQRYDFVLNASWNGRLAIDESLGVPLPPSWNFRVKHFLRVQLDRDLPSLPTMTLVLGPFGDVVPYTQRDLYLSWYPVGRTAWTCAVSPGPDLLKLDEDAQRQVRDGIMTSLAEIFPSLRGIEANVVESRLCGGFIYAEGRSDLDDPETTLHSRRSEIVRQGNYFSVNPGKLGYAPALAEEAAAAIAP